MLRAIVSRSLQVGQVLYNSHVDVVGQWVKPAAYEVILQQRRWALPSRHRMFWMLGRMAYPLQKENVRVGWSRKDELIIDARWGLLRTTYCCTVADCRPRRNSSTCDRTGRSWIIEMDLVFSKDVFLSLKRCVSLSSSSWLNDIFAARLQRKPPGHGGILIVQPVLMDATSTWGHSKAARPRCLASVFFLCFFSLPGSLLRVSHAELRWLRAILGTNRNHASNLAGWDVINEPMIHPYTDCSIFIVLAYWL